MSRATEFPSVVIRIGRPREPTKRQAMSPRPALALVASTFLIAAASESSHHWSYSGAEGPSHWGGTCATGKIQSPIDIRTASAKAQKLPPLSFSYRPTALHIIDNGHSIQVDVDKGSTLAVGGVRFPLVQFHFHKPSEEAIDGHRFAMVVHLVHRDAEGNLAVVGVPLEAGAANPMIATLWRKLPHQKGKEASPAGVTIDPSQLLPSDLSYFSFVGSLTTPPCTEGVRWFVMEQDLSVSREQVRQVSGLFRMSSRQLQDPHGRKIEANE